MASPTRVGEGRASPPYRHVLAGPKRTELIVAFPQLLNPHAPQVELRGRSARMTEDA